MRAWDLRSKWRRFLTNQQIEDGAVRATARLPGLKIEIVHSRSPAADAERISINLQADPSFETFGRVLQTAGPFVFWAQATQMAWLPWLEAASALMFPRSVTSATPKVGTRRSLRGGTRSLGTDRAARSKGVSS
jgi:hypothetical protein